MAVRASLRLGAGELAPYFGPESVSAGAGFGLRTPPITA